MPALEVVQADVTALEVDAVANAANTELRHGGGVAAAIARAAGPELERESRERAPIGLGEAVETTAGDMPARWVIHAATMELGGPTSAEIIESATRSTLDRAEDLGCRSLALVAFGTGVGGFPLHEGSGLGVVEMARASGLDLVAEDERDAFAASTRGTGELIAAAVEAGASEVLVAAGGSATTDGGAGAVRALSDVGVRPDLVVACDVRTPWEDAPRVFGPQKGADPDTVRRLERRMTR